MLLTGLATSAAQEKPEWGYEFNFRNLYVPEDLYWNLPPRLAEHLGSFSSKRVYTVNSKVNPFYLALDMDSNGTEDYALYVQDFISKKDGVLLCGVGKECILVGAGNDVEMKWREGGEKVYKRTFTDLAFQSWHVSHGIIRDGKEGFFPDNAGASIIVSKPEAWAHHIYWDGSGIVFR